MTANASAAHLVGGGIACLATAVLLLRDAGYRGDRIHIYEQSGVLGGSLDACGTSHSGYVTRGGRMFEQHFACTYDLLASIPTLDDPELSVAEEIAHFTQRIVTSSKCRLVDDGVRLEAPPFQLSLRDKWDLIRLTLRRERSLDGITIEQYFSAEFLESNFWLMWSTMFAFQEWHSVSEFRRYARRFMHLLPGFNRLEGIYRTRLNQYDSIVRPIVNYLAAENVNFHLQSPVTAIDFDSDARHAARIHLGTDDRQILSIAPHDKVFITLGSMTEASSLGSMTSAPALSADADPGAWHLWRQIAQKNPEFGRPDNFAGNIDKTLWESFTVTLTDPRFFSFMEEFTGNAAGTGGLVTFRNSSWRLSVVLAHQPHFARQKAGEFVFWGYGLKPQRRGDYVNKPMLECSGTEILRELAGHFAGESQLQDMFANANCIPCLMPYITAQFMPRTSSSRPQVVPEVAENYAFLGQFCELPDDTVFTVEYSVRCAQTAVYQLCNNDREITALYRGFEKPGVIARALRTIASNGS